MKNKGRWKPNKFVYKKGRFIASRDPREVAISSRLVADLVAGFYNTYIGKHCRGNLIDLGCGKVPFYEAYKNYISDNTCVDWADTLHKNEYLDFECDLTKDLPFENGQFDTIILSDVLEHIPRPEYLWKEMFRILAGGGKILMNVPFYYWLHEPPHDYYRYTEYSLRRFAESEGLKVLVLEPIGGAPEILADILAKNLLKIPRIGRTLSIGIQYLTYKFIRTSLGERISKKTSKVFPFGYFMVVEKIIR